MNTRSPYPYPSPRCPDCGQGLGQAWTPPPSSRLIGVDPWRREVWLVPVSTPESGIVGRAVTLLAEPATLVTGRLAQPGSAAAVPVTGYAWHGSTCPRRPAGRPVSLDPPARSSPAGRPAPSTVSIQEERTMPIRKVLETPSRPSPALTGAGPAPGVPEPDSPEQPAGVARPAPALAAAPRATGDPPLGTPLAGWTISQLPPPELAQAEPEAPPPPTP
jgi:hypothetical protein